MKTLILLLASAVLLAPSLAGSDTVYRCLRNGRVLFSDGPAGPACEPVELKVSRPNPEDLARLEENERLRAEQERADREQRERDQLLRAQTDAARAARSQAEAQRRLAEAQARSAGQPSNALPYSGWWPGYGYRPRPPYPTPYPPPGFRPRPPPLPPRPLPPRYPYPPDRISVEGSEGR